MIDRGNKWYMNNKRAQLLYTHMSVTCPPFPLSMKPEAWTFWKHPSDGLIRAVLPDGATPLVVGHRMRQMVLYSLHNDHRSGESNIQKAHSLFWWPTMTVDIRAWWRLHIMRFCKQQQLLISE